MKASNPDGSKVRLAPPSLTGLFGLATENGSLGAGVFHFGVWKHDTLRYTGALMFPSMNLDFYGIGDYLPIDSVSYNLKGSFFLQELLARIADSDFFLGETTKTLNLTSSLILLSTSRISLRAFQFARPESVLSPSMTAAVQSSHRIMAPI